MFVHPLLGHSLGRIVRLSAGYVTHSICDCLPALCWDVTCHGPALCSDKKSDRVEIPPEYLAGAAQQAEEIASSTGVPTRVVGWYHSHPKYRSWLALAPCSTSSALSIHSLHFVGEWNPVPSHVDLQTQYVYQVMDPTWIGLIFSVFNADKATRLNRIQLHGFQSGVPPPSQPDPSSLAPVRAHEHTHIQVPVHMVQDLHPSNQYQPLISMQRQLFQEERGAFTSASASQSSPSALLHHSAVYQKHLAK
eukprot:gene3240-3754_t